MMTVEIRRVTDAEIPILASVHVRAWQWAYRGLMPDAFLNALDLGRRTAGWDRMIRDEGVPRPHVAVVDTEIVGFIHADHSRDADLGPQAGEVTALYLLEEHVGMGVGHQLWEAALEQLRENGHHALSVWVLETNRRGRRFYESMGMIADGTTKEESIGGFVLSEMRYHSALGR